MSWRWNELGESMEDSSNRCCQLFQQREREIWRNKRQSIKQINDSLDR